MRRLNVLAIGTLLTLGALAGTALAKEGAVSKLDALPPGGLHAGQMIPVGFTMLMDGVEPYKADIAEIVVRNGTDLDATDGVVKITVVRDTSGTLDSVDAWGGAFDVRQTVAKNAQPLTTLTLLGSTGQTSHHVAQAARNRTSRLWVNGKGNFKTRGKRASAIVRGTYWLTQETSAGTKVTVRVPAIGKGGRS